LKTFAINMAGFDVAILKSDLIAGLPYFSWCIIPKRGKYTKGPHNIPIDHKIYLNFPLQCLPKNLKICNLWYENLTFGNPVRHWKYSISIWNLAGKKSDLQADPPISNSPSVLGGTFRSGLPDEFMKNRPKWSSDYHLWKLLDTFYRGKSPKNLIYFWDFQNNKTKQIGWSIGENSTNLVTLVPQSTADWRTLTNRRRADLKHPEAGSCNKTLLLNLQCPIWTCWD
jgi:hypothetical protein